MHTHAVKHKYTSVFTGICKCTYVDIHKFVQAYKVDIPGCGRLADQDAWTVGELCILVVRAHTTGETRRDLLCASNQH